MQLKVNVVYLLIKKILCVNSPILQNKKLMEASVQWNVRNVCEYVFTQIYETYL